MTLISWLRRASRASAIVMAHRAGACSGPSSVELDVAEPLAVVADVATVSLLLRKPVDRPQDLGARRAVVGQLDYEMAGVGLSVVIAVDLARRDRDAAELHQAA